MRAPFIRSLVELAEQDPRIVLLTGDLGYLSIEPFVDRFPERFVNMGVAEQNMVGVATGLAEAGYIPFVYSIASFAVLRPYEFIRNGPAYHQLPVRLIGIGGGFEYGHDGISHYALEDIGVLRIQPGVMVVVPADYEQAQSALRATYQLNLPVYYRLSKDDKTIIPGLNGRFSATEIQLIREGEDYLILSTGIITREVVQAAAQLDQAGIHTAVGVAACLNPPPVDSLLAVLRNYTRVMTVESHYLNGGLGSLVAEVVADHGLGCQVERIAVRQMPDGRTGSQNFMQGLAGLNSEAIVARVRNSLLMRDDG
jgi:transketolase